MIALKAEMGTSWNMFIGKSLSWTMLLQPSGIMPRRLRYRYCTWLPVRLFSTRNRARFPGKVSAWGTTVDTFGLPNVHACEQLPTRAVLNGVMAALLTETKVIGVVGPIEPVMPSSRPIVAGVHSVDPSTMCA